MKIFLKISIILGLCFVSQTVAAQSEEAADFADKQIVAAKSLLPMKIDEGTVWADFIREGQTVAYLYNINMDASNFTREQKDLVAIKMKEMLCPTLELAMCGATKMILEKGFSVETRYRDMKGTELFICTFTPAACERALINQEQNQQ